MATTLANSAAKPSNSIAPRDSPTSNSGPADGVSGAPGADSTSSLVPVWPLPACALYREGYGWLERLFHNLWAKIVWNFRYLLIVLFMAILVLQASIVLPRLEIGDKEVGVPVRILSRAVVVLALGACTVSGALCAVCCVLQGVW